MQTFEGETADEVWRKAVDQFRHNRGTRPQTSRAGRTSELLHSAFVIQNPTQRWVTSRRPAISVAFAIVEAVGVLSGRREASFFNYWNPILPKYAGHVKDYDGAYGFRLRHSFGSDQLERAYLALRNEPDSRQVVLHIWDPTLDLPTVEGRPAAGDVPCNVCSMLKIRDGKLDWTQVLRSNDLFLGVPYNFVQFTTLQEVIAGWLGLRVGSYTHIADSLHIYDSDLARIFDYKAEAPILSGDSLSLEKPPFDHVLESLVKCIDDLVRPSLTQADILSLTEQELPPGYKNLLVVVAAEAARKRGWPGLTSEVMARCTNPALNRLWASWVRRKGGASTPAR